MVDWKQIEFEDVPTVAEFLELTLALMEQGHTNSDQMRSAILAERKLLAGKRIGSWNDTPAGKFINNHAHALKQLKLDSMIERTSPKHYRLFNDHRASEGINVAHNERDT